MSRHRDWRKRLSDAIERRRRMPFSDLNNCAEFVADCVVAMGGPDFLATVRGRYRTIPQGLVMLREQGHADLCELLRTFFREIPVAFAVAGDLVAFPAEQGGWSLGIVNGERVTVLTPEGLGSLSRAQGSRAFQVPR